MRYFRLSFVVFWLYLVDATVNQTALDCQMRTLALRYARYIQPWISDEAMRSIFDALELQRLCHRSFPVASSREGAPAASLASTECATRHCIVVDSTLQEALDQSRAIGEPDETTLVLPEGIHSLRRTLRLGPDDSGLTILGQQNAWISGALRIPTDQHWDWDCQENVHARVTNLSALLEGIDFPRLPSLFTTARRYVRARFPNSNPEVDQWGYASPQRHTFSIPSDRVIEWHRPPRGALPRFVYQAVPNSSSPLYNAYTEGYGGVCDLWDGDGSYWCGNASAGGWSEVDRECATTAQLQIPNGMTVEPILYERWMSQNLTGAIVHAWHSQSWAMHMFPVAGNNATSIWFAKGAGKQGGRNWCRCDQCTYAGRWCGQHQDPPYEDNRLIGGSWLLENTLHELDAPGEYFFDPETKLLYVYPNQTDDLQDLRFAILEELIVLDGAPNVTIRNVGFRDTAATYTGSWGVPSGGDWALHRGGTLLLHNASRIRVQDCLFRRLDSNAIFLSGRTRNVTIERSQFEWLGENGIATWGDTNGLDATAGDFPMYTTVEGCIFRELGIYQKQSSGYGQAKSKHSFLRNNIMFNLPRAAVNFNDGMGGGDIVSRNLLFNTCRESGDHGPINSWDRQPFLNLHSPGLEPSYNMLPRTIELNLIIANYNAMGGVDNDDGSSWYRVRKNVLYHSDGFKMDYGGHDSIFEKNLVMAYPDHGDQRCVLFGRFLPEHGHVVRDNICAVPSDKDVVLEFASCEDSNANLYNNTYFTPSGNGSARCYDSGTIISFDKLQADGLETNSTLQAGPDSATILTQWAIDVLVDRVDVPCQL